MMQRVAGLVESILEERPGAQELCVLLEEPDRELPAADHPTRTALNIVALTGRAQPGDRVLLNTLAVEMGLGTGGLDFVVAQMDRLPEDKPPDGHIMKLRYTPLQVAVLAVEAPESEHHDALRLFSSLDDIPVVCMELHSQLPAICAAAHWSARIQSCTRQPRIVYVMTDSAALPLALSRTVPQIKQRGWLHATVTCGQAFGGDYEAVNIYSGMAAAYAAAEADIIVAGPGPGTVGTSTPLGFSGIDQGLAINAAASLGGVPIVAPRISFADKRSRHIGLSHHTITVLQKVARAATLVALPRLPEQQRRAVDECLAASGMDDRHEAVYIDADKGLQALIDSGFTAQTMGRSLQDERAFFLAAAATGLLASQFAEVRIGGRAECDVRIRKTAPTVVE